MHKHIADLWIADLEKNPPQTRQKLYDGHGYCCLGRLCLLAGMKPEVFYDQRDYGFAGESAVLPRAVMEWAGMKSRSGEYDDDHCLSADNDNGATFPEIAQIIRVNC